ncbi:hypothetical protein [Paenibacillus sp. BJ-4]|nr:hypothetical protein [Paenibacillus sp. BJ-4]
MDSKLGINQADEIMVIFEAYTAYFRGKGGDVDVFVYGRLPALSSGL